MARVACDPGTFGNRLALIRRRRGVSQRWLAAEAGISDSFVCQIERGRTSPSADVLDRLADVLGFTMDELWRGVGRMEELLSAGPRGGP